MWLFFLQRALWFCLEPKIHLVRPVSLQIYWSCWVATFASLDHISLSLTDSDGGFLRFLIESIYWIDVVYALWTLQSARKKDVPRQNLVFYLRSCSYSKTEIGLSLMNCFTMVSPLNLPLMTNGTYGSSGFLHICGCKIFETLLFNKLGLLNQSETIRFSKSPAVQERSSKG